MKKVCIFAAFTPRTSLMTSIGTAIFIFAVAALSANIGLLNSIGRCTERSEIVRGGTGVDSPYLFTFSFKPRTMKNSSTGQNLSSNTSKRRTVVSYKAFDREFNAKNKAYHFIITSGLLSQYSAYCSNVQGLSDPHAACLYVLSTLKNNKK
jgi:hypothetical protein